MKDCAAQIGSKIMNATNVAFSAPLPRSVKQFGGDHYNKPVSTTKRSHIILEDDIRVISPRRLKPKLSTEEEHEDEDVEKIVDSLFDNVDSRVLVPPAQKRARLSSSDDYMNPAS